MLMGMTLLLCTFLINCSFATQLPFSSGPSILSSTVSHHRVVRVPEEHTSLAEAVTLSKNGDRILVGPGIYYETLTLPNHDLSIESTHGAEDTFIDGGGNSLKPSPNSIIQLGPYAGKVQISGFTIQHGWSNEGGGLRVAGGSIEVKDCQFNSCHSIFGGGLCLLQGTLRLTNCEVHHCSATFGGGIAVITGDAHLANTTVSNCTAEASGGGGWCDNAGWVKANGCTWVNCSASQGGALSIQGQLRLERSLVHSCQSEGHGGGLQLTAAASGNLHQVRMHENNAQVGGGIHVAAGATLHAQRITIFCCEANRGGGISTLGKSTIHQATIRSCKAQAGGGAISLGRAHPQAILKIHNAVIKENEANHGGAVYGDPTGYLSLINTDLQENQARHDGGGLHLHGVECWLEDVAFSGNRAPKTTDLFFRDGRLSWFNISRSGPVYGTGAILLDGPELELAVARTASKD